MPRDGSDVYTIPLGTEGVPDTTIESEKYNVFAHDVELDLNTPRPISVGGTNATNADEALFELGAEKARQVVTNFTAHLWVPGSFYAAPGATDAPIAGHAFVGHVEIYDANNGVIYAHDLNSLAKPPAVYVKQKLLGVWETGWSTDPGTVITTAPPAPGTVTENSFYWDAETGLLYILYNDGNTTQWVIACPQPPLDMYIKRQGDSMVGALHLRAAMPTADTEAAHKKYVDQEIIDNVPPPIVAVGTVMLFYQADAPLGWTRVTSEHDKILRVVGSTAGGVAGGTNPFSTVNAAANTGNHTLALADIPVGITSYGSNAINVYPGGSGAYYTPVSSASWGNSGPNGGGGVPFDTGWTQLITYSGTNNIYTASYGGGGAHSHPITLAMQYVDIILARFGP